MHIFQEELKRITADLEITFRGMKISPIVTKSNEIDHIFLEDFLFITTWLKEHSEVKYVHIEWDVKTLQNPTFKSEQELQLYRIKFLQLQKSISQCAATFFFTGSGQFSLYWSEFLALFEDVTLQTNSEVIFNHTKKGLITILDSSIIQKNLGLKRSHLTIPRIINLKETQIEELDLNSRKNKSKELKEIIFNQSELSKIQMRASVNQESDHHSLYNGNFKSGDWLKPVKKFSKLRDLKANVKAEDVGEYLN